MFKMFWCKVHLTSFTASFFHHTVFFLLICSCAGQSQVIGPKEPILVTFGDDIVLPCHLEPATDAVAMTLEWSRSDLNPRYVHVRHEGRELAKFQHPSYKGRTSLSIDKLKLGDISLKLSRVKLSDDGTYRCFVPETKSDSTVELVVGSASSPVISLDKDSGGVVLQCESSGWFPEPEVLWLDAEGSVVSAGRTETLRRPDGFFTVSSRATVEKRRSNNFTCRVQQLRINQTRETHTHVPDDFFTVCSSSALHVTVGLFVAVVVVSAVVFVLWNWRHELAVYLHRDSKRQNENGKCLLAKVELGQEEVERCMKQLEDQLAEDKGLKEELEQKLDSVGDESTKNGGNETENKEDRFWKMKNITTEIKHKLEDQHMKHEELLMSIKEVLVKRQSENTEVKIKSSDTEGTK